jgi:phosphoribosyl-dephospho-CoA transferase
MGADEAPQRHAIAAIDAVRWRAALTGALAEEHSTLLASWFGAGRPAVVTGARTGSVASIVPLGVPLPPSMGRLRIALSLRREAVRAVSPPPRLRTALACAPAAWRPGLASLEARASAAGVTFRTFGSLAWQFLTGLPYLTERSDVDLLFHPTTRTSLEAGVALLWEWQASHGLRADGEIVLPDGRAVAWREWLQPAAEVLAKGRTGVALVPRAELLRTLA